MTNPETPNSTGNGGGSGLERSPRRARKVRAEVLLLAVVAAGAAPLIASACQTNAPSDGFNATSTGTPGSTGGGQGGGNLFDDAGVQSPVTITPWNPILKLALPLTAQTIPFACNDTSSGLPVDAEWTLSSLELGTISKTGVFTPNGTRNGEVVVTCKQKSNPLITAQTTLRVIIHALDNQGGVTQQQMSTLRGPPGLPDPQWQFLYPYDETIFPRGILAPEVHLTTGSSAGNVFYMQISAKEYDYEGFFATSGSDTQLQMSQQAWEALSNAASGTKIEVRVSKLFNGQKVGPIFRRFTIANGKLHGTIYYNTYDSPLAGQTGAMMRIKGNSPTAEVLLGDCTVCHSVGADGSTAAAANHNGNGGTFDLTGGNVNPPNVWFDPGLGAFAGVYPKNGEVVVVNGAPGNGNTPGTGGTYKSDLRTKNGTIIMNSGIEAFYAQTPVFSIDGSKLAFCDRSQLGTSALAIMSYDSITQKFDNYDVLGTPKQGRHLSWPAFTPDGKYVIYQDGMGDDLVTWGSNTGRIFAVDIATKQITYLANLNGDGYVPQGERDLNKNYEPTMAPLASGGYFWIMFTSRRTYGNKLTGDQSQTKRLWVSAIDINAPPGKDSSHPAFYIAGQELTSGNSRGFWALDPCKQDGKGCESGDECCNEFCNPTGDPPVFLCGPPDGNCSEEFEACKTKEDCCDPDADCIGGKCSQPPPD